jgi:hypothetical protein
MRLSIRNKLHYWRIKVKNKILAREVVEPVQPEQYAYGNIEILRAAAGINDNQFVLNYVIHHANHLSTFKNEFFDHYSLVGTPYKHIISSYAEVKTSQNKIHGEIVAIGSPWLYFCRMNGIDVAQLLEKSDLSWTTLNVDTRIKNAQKILYLPSHSSLVSATETSKTFSRIYSKYDLKSKNLKICLGWIDFCTNRIRNYFSELGLPITTAGIGYHLVPEFSGGDRTEFYQNLLDLFRSSDLVLADHYTNGLLFAASIGVPCAIVEINHSECVTASVNSEWNHCFGDEINSEIRNHAPFLIELSTPPEMRKSIRKWLGYGNLMSEDELRSLDWVRKTRS